jgi:hypothetical protein
MAAIYFMVEKVEGGTSATVLRLFYWTLLRGFKLGIQSLYKDLSHLKF